MSISSFWMYWAVAWLTLALAVVNFWLLAWIVCRVAKKASEVEK